MRLKTIKLAGFKSFVDPTQVSFPSNMSAVVGPNGCGKSNIIDAVRWVMGESSAKTLRGESMADVIFNGTTGRQPVSQASIELIFDNGDGKIGGEYAAYAEISVRRSVSREGGSDYFLNGTKCRRRDITDLFLGTGLGPRSYAIIEQGMISRLIESRPEDLRVFIEEAAGISKYKERRRETESRMRRTQENLERLTDLREELERQLAHLQRQAQAAERYAEYREEERVAKSELLALQWRGIGNDTEAARQRLGDLEVRQEALRADFERVSAAIEALRVEHADASDTFNAVQADYYSVGGEVTRVEQSLQFEQERRAATSRELDATCASLAQASGHLDTDRQQLADWQVQLAELEPRLAALAGDSEARAAALADAEQAMADWQARWDGFNERAAGPARTADVQQSRIRHLEQVLSRLGERSHRLHGERTSLGDSRDSHDLSALETAVSRATAAVVERESELTSLQTQNSETRERINATSAAQDQLRSQLQQLRGREASVEALIEGATRTPVAETVGNWLGSRGIGPVCPVFESLSVDDGWAAAVELVLGEVLTAVTVADVAGVLAAAQGSLPEGALLIDQGPGSGLPEGSLAAKVQGPAALVAWLGSVRTAATLADAVARLPALEPGESVITPDGVWLGPGWLRVRHAAAGDGVMALRTSLEQTRSEIATAAAALADVDAQLDALRTERGRLEAAIAGAQQSLKQALETRAESAAEHRAALSDIEQQRQQSERISADLEEVLAQVTHEQAALGAARGALQEALDAMAADAGERAQLQAEREARTDAVAQAREAARASRDRAHQLDLQTQNLRAQVNTVSGAINRLEQQVAELSDRAAALRAQLPTEDDPDAALRAELETLLARRVDAEAALAAARQQMADKEHALRQSEQERVALEHKLQAVHGDIEADKLGQAERRVRTENLESQLLALGAEPADTAAQLPEDSSEAELAVQVERLAARIARLGPINLAAIDECSRASERKAYLDAQNEDLESALETLQNAIRKIDRETRSRFRDTFDQVNAGFAELFPRVFGGGTASLEMTGDDLLDTGVAIMARPPGKKNSTIHLLSGGEKAMTAIALVFSIFQLNPAPFCMLDEVDAPLDDANVGRYARMVKEMSEKVQFVFITHNKITMEAADQLMGVTMHEPGVSRLVTVDIDVATQLAAS